MLVPVSISQNIMSDNNMVMGDTKFYLKIMNILEIQINNYVYNDH